VQHLDRRRDVREQRIGPARAGQLDGVEPELRVPARHDPAAQRQRQQLRAEAEAQGRHARERRRAEQGALRRQVRVGLVVVRPRPAAEGDDGGVPAERWQRRPVGTHDIGRHAVRAERPDQPVGRIGRAVLQDQHAAHGAGHRYAGTVVGGSTKSAGGAMSTGASTEATTQSSSPPLACVHR
jgi:hypothetical protein